MNHTDAAAQQIRAPNKRARSINAVLDTSMYSGGAGGITLWRASQLAHGRGRTVDTGYPALCAELPGGGWPVGVLVDLLVQQAGVGEMRLLRPALSGMGKRPVAMVPPPHIPNGLGLEYIGLSPEQLMQIRASKTTTATTASVKTIWIRQQEKESTIAMRQQARCRRRRDPRPCTRAQSLSLNVCFECQIAAESAKS